MTALRTLRRRLADMETRRARRDATHAETHGAEEWGRLFSAFADRHFARDFEACAFALEAALDADPIPADVAGLLEAMRARPDPDCTPEGFLRAMARVIRLFCAPGSLEGAS